MASVTTQPNFELRIYDGTASTPFYVSATFLEPPTLPMAAPRPETTVVIGGGRAVDGNIASIIPDEAVIFQPIPFTLRFAVQSERLGVLDALGNPRGSSPWTVGSDTWVPIPPANLGTRNNSSGVAVTLPGPKDADQIAGMYDVIIIDSVPADAPVGEVFGIHLKGVVTQDARHAVEAPQVFFEVDCLLFGEIDNTITAFPAGGVESTLP